VHIWSAQEPSTMMMMIIIIPILSTHSLARPCQPIAQCKTLT
jgi:hypothetical protein